MRGGCQEKSNHTTWSMDARWPRARGRPIGGDIVFGKETHLVGRGAARGADGPRAGRRAAANGDGLAGESRGREGAHRVVFVDVSDLEGLLWMPAGDARGVFSTRLNKRATRQQLEKEGGTDRAGATRSGTSVRRQGDDSWQSVLDDWKLIEKSPFFPLSNVSLVARPGAPLRRARRPGAGRGR